MLQSTYMSNAPHISYLYTISPETLIKSVVRHYSAKVIVLATGQKSSHYTLKTSLRKEPWTSFSKHQRSSCERPSSQAHCLQGEFYVEDNRFKEILQWSCWGNERYDIWRESGGGESCAGAGCELWLGPGTNLGWFV
jgi:hypothetical protein